MKLASRLFTTTTAVWLTIGTLVKSQWYWWEPRVSAALIYECISVPSWQSHVPSFPLSSCYSSDDESLWVNWLFISRWLFCLLGFLSCLAAGLVALQGLIWGGTQISLQHLWERGYCREYSKKIFSVFAGPSGFVGPQGMLNLGRWISSVTKCYKSDQFSLISRSDQYLPFLSADGSDISKLQQCFKKQMWTILLLTISDHPLNPIGMQWRCFATWNKHTHPPSCFPKPCSEAAASHSCPMGKRGKGKVPVIFQFL